MVSQWECFLKNIGEWHGSFTRFSPQGEELEDIPSILSLKSLNNNQKIHLLLRRFPSGKPPQEMTLEYNSPRDDALFDDLLFFENGAFCRGYPKWSRDNNFGAEFSLIVNQRRLRLVQLFNQEGCLKSLTLIREKLADSNVSQIPPLTVEQLLGEWRGEALTVYPNSNNSNCPNLYPTHLKIERQDSNQLQQQLTFGTGEEAHTIISCARIDGSIFLHFEQGNLPVQILLLPDGASCNCPLKIKPNQAFFLELGWLIQPNQRQRLIRNYSAQGDLLSITLVQETKIDKF